MIDALIVVEGQNDAQAVRRALGDVDIVWTEGFGLTRAKITYLQKAARERVIMVCTDPDRAGVVIRAAVERHIPGVIHVYLSRAVAREARTGDIGIEHAAPAEIRAAFERAAATTSWQEQPESGSLEANQWQRQDLLELGLSGSERASNRRQWLGHRLGIGDANAKQFCRRLNSLKIARADLEALLRAEEECGR